MELNEMRGRARAVFSYFMINVVDLAFGRVSSFSSVDLYFNDVLRNIGKVSELQGKCGGPRTQLSSLVSESGTWRWFPRDRDDRNIKRPCFIATSKDEYMLH